MVSRNSSSGSGTITRSENNRQFVVFGETFGERAGELPDGLEAIRSATVQAVPQRREVGRGTQDKGSWG